jgi:hypothetical protein
MCELLREGLAAGATGLSSGVFYATGAAADVAELALLAGVTGAAGGVYTTHIRQEMDKVIDSLDEAFATARRGEVPLVVSHHKCAGPRNWGRTVETLAHIDAARREQAIGLDCYPYIAGSTVLRSEWSTASSTSSSPGRRRTRRWRRARSPASPTSGAAARCKLRASATRRRLLLPDARGRRPARAPVPGGP